MARIDTIVILRHRQGHLLQSALLARIAIEFWMAEGRRVFVHPDDERWLDGDAAFLHVDLTHVPDRFAARAAQYPIAINAGVRDISKRHVCTTLVHPDDPYDGAVIVKTDLNHRALPERRSGMVRKNWDWILPPDRYPTFACKDDVPDRVWRDPDLVVQRLHVERKDDFYVNRNWYFLGDRDVVTTFYRSDPVAKAGTEVRRLPLSHDVPEALRQRRAELGFEYGKFDFVIEDGQPVLLDANATPHDAEIATSSTGRICSQLAAGLDSFAGN